MTMGSISIRIQNCAILVFSTWNAQSHFCDLNHGGTLTNTPLEATTSWKLKPLSAIILLPDSKRSISLALSIISDTWPLYACTEIDWPQRCLENINFSLAFLCFTLILQQDSATSIPQVWLNIVNNSCKWIKHWESSVNVCQLVM